MPAAVMEIIDGPSRGPVPVTPEQITLAGVLIAIGVAGAAGKWVFGWVYTAMVADRDWWRDKALGAHGLADIATDQAEKAERKVKL